MLFIILATILLAVVGAEDVQNEITSDIIVRTSSTEKNDEPREYIDQTPIVRPSNLSQKSRRSRYLRQAARPRRRPTFEYQIPRRSNNNYPNLYGPRNRFKPNGVRFRPGPPISRYRYHADNWRQKWPYHNQPYYEDEEMDGEAPTDEYDDDIDEYKNDDAYYSEKYRDIYDDAMPVSTKYNEKRSPYRYHVSKPRTKSRNMIDFQKEFLEWPERNRFSKNYRDYVEMMATAKKYANEEDSIVGHRFAYSRPYSKFKLLEEDELDFSSTAGSKNRRFKIERRPVFPFRRPSTEETPYENHFADVSKYSTTVRDSTPHKQSTQKAVYSAKYHGREPAAEQEQRTKMNIDETPSEDGPSNVVHDWKRNQRLQNVDVYNQFTASNKAQLMEYDKSTEGSLTTDQSYKDDGLLPGELIAYMSADPADASTVGKEEGYLRSAFPFIHKFTDRDIFKSTYLRNISPTSDHNTEVILDEGMSNWKH